MMEILKAHQTKNRCYIQSRKVEHVGILVHSTGAVNKSLKRYVDSPERLGKNAYGNHWNNAKADKAMHAFIGYDKDNKVIVAETLPLDISCWGSGSGKKGSRNRTHIQFEICQGSDTDSGYYKAAIAIAEEYCAHLCKMRGWSTDAITSHKEQAEAGYASNHGDPESWMKHFGDNMDKFRARVKARINGTSDKPIITEGQTGKEPEKGNPAQGGTEYETYTVKKGDNLWRIAQKTLGSGPKYKAIVTLNNLTSEKLHIGQVLKIRAKSGTSSPTTTTQTTYTEYTVKRGDTLWKIAKKQLGNSNRYNEIIALNALTNTNIKTGQKLKIPEA